MVRDEYGTWSPSTPSLPASTRYKFIIDGEAVPDPDIEDKVSDGMGGWATPLAVKSRKNSITRVYTVDWCPKSIDCRRGCRL